MKKVCPPSLLLTLLFILQFPTSGYLQAQTPDLTEEERDSLIHASVFNIRKAHAFIGTNNYHLSFLHFQKGATIAEQAGDVEKMEHSIDGMAYVASRVGRFDEAKELSWQAINMAETNFPENYLRQMERYLTLGNIYFFIGDNYSALYTFHKAEALHDKSVDGYSSKSKHVFNNLGVLYRSYNNLEKSRFYLQKAIRIYESEGHDLPIGYSSSNLGKLYFHFEQYDSALAYYLPFLTLLEERDSREDDRQRITLLTHIAYSWGKLNEEDKALKSFEQARSLLDPTPVSYDVERMNLYEKMAAYYHVKDPLKAIEYIQQAVSTICPDYSPDDFRTLPAPSTARDERNLVFLLAHRSEAIHTLYAQGKLTLADLKSANETIKVADEINRKWREEIDNRKSRHSQAEKSFEVFDIGMGIAYELYIKTGEVQFMEDAFLYAEKNKGISLRENLSLHQNQTQSILPDSVARKLSELKSTMDLHEEELILFEKSPEAVAKTKIELDEAAITASTKYNEFVNQIENNYPGYDQPKFVSRTASISDIQLSLKDRESIFIEYFVGTKQIFIFAITATQKALYAIPNTPEFLALLSSLSSYFQSPNPSFSSTETYANLFQGFQLLLGNNPLLYPKGETDFPKFSNLIIVPDNELNNISFEALLSAPNSPETSTRELPWLVKQFEINYAQSATLYLDHLKSPSIRKELTCLAFAPTPDEDFSEIALRGNLETLRSAHGTLPGALEEVKNIAHFLKGDFYFGANASEHVFKTHASEDYSIIHLATHAQANEKNPDLSRLIFSQNESGKEDNHLHVYEMNSINLITDLVVLSACETSNGKLVRGEGIQSIATSFIASGASSVITSLWKVEDQATQQIMSSFYEALNNGNSRKFALRKAKLDYLENADNLTSHPFYWAAFVLVGDSRPLKARSNSLFWLILGGSILCFATIVLLLSSRNKDTLS